MEKIIRVILQYTWTRTNTRWLFQTEHLISISTTNLISQTSKQSRHPVDAYAALFMITPRYHVALDDGLDNVIVVDGVPVIDKPKLDKLVTKISREFTKKGAALKPENIFVPWDNASGKSKGCVNTILHIGGIANWLLFSYIFVDAGSADAATFAINAMHGHPFDSKHTFLINRFTDIEQYAEMDETYVEPKIEEFHPKVRG